uniref:Calponin-homology (CH) domain-containing protein n=1 Tax=Trichuris muris TaxID=70415 RepID=A0A5S6QD68_TRIMR
MDIGQSSLSPVDGADSPMPADVKGLEVYELNLEKYKDRRDNVQKKTFTKWVNKHLKKADDAAQVENLFTDLQDGELLLLLLEVLTGETMQRERGRMRFHRIQNVQTCLSFLRSLNVKLVNIRAEDIVDGNTKLTLGLVWTIILHFQVSQPAALVHPTGAVEDRIARVDSREFVCTV